MMPKNILTKLFKRDNSPKGMITHRLHRRRPIITMLVRFADWLPSDWLDGNLSLINDYGMRGWLVYWRRTVRDAGIWGAIKEEGTYAREGLAHIAAVLIARVMGLKGWQWLLYGIADVARRGEVAAHAGRAAFAVGDVLDPDLVIKRDAAEAERKAKENAEFEDQLKAPSKLSPSQQALCTLNVNMHYLECEPEAVRPEKIYSLDVLMWQLWRAVPEEGRRTVFQAMFDEAYQHVGDEQQPIIDVYSNIADHVLGDTEAIENALYDLWPHEPEGIENAREELKRWRKGGAGWLADIYEPRVNERAIKIMNRSNGTLPGAA
jgi:hypothetical protein